MNSELVELKNKWERKTNEQYENGVSDEKNRLGKPYFSGPAFFFLKIKYSGSALRANGLIVFVGFVN